MNVLELAGAVGEEAGGKAAPLAQLIRAGFNVPQGFVIPTYVYRRVAAENGLPVSCLVDAAEIRDRILNFRLPEEVVQDISRALEELARKASTNYVAVRSSSTAEDAASTSAAGQHDSVLAVRGTEQVCRPSSHAGPRCGPTEQPHIVLIRASTRTNSIWPWWCNGSSTLTLLELCSPVTPA